MIGGNKTTINDILNMPKDKLRSFNKNDSKIMKLLYAKCKKASKCLNILKKPGDRDRDRVYGIITYVGQSDAEQGHIIVRIFDHR
eukprot:UN09874